MTVLEWQRRAEPLAPGGLVADGAVARQLLAQLRPLAEQVLARLRIVATRDLLVVLGADLPWFDGVRYCAPDPAAPTLWLPTHLAPTLAPDLLRRSLAARAGAGPVLLWNAPEHMLPLADARALTPALLDWLDGVVA